MSKSIKLNDNTYLDSSGVTHNRVLLSTILESKIIYDSGSNSNGSYIRYTDGTMICYINKAFLVDTNIAWGNVYESVNVQLGSFPQPFVEKPVVTVSCVGGTTVWVEALNATRTSLGSSWFMRPVSTKNVSTELSFIAIGKWK